MRKQAIINKQIERNKFMNRKYLVTIGVVIAIILLLYWLFVAEDLNAWLNVN
jgi:hypothetical protein